MHETVEIIGDPYFLCEDCGAPATYYHATEQRHGHYFCEDCRCAAGLCRRLHGLNPDRTHRHTPWDVQRKNHTAAYIECLSCGHYQWTTGVLPRSVVHVEECYPCKMRREDEEISTARKRLWISDICPHPRACVEHGRCSTQGKCND